MRPTPTGSKGIIPQPCILNERNAQTKQTNHRNRRLLNKHRACSSSSGTTEERGMGVFNSLPSHTSDVDRDYAELRAKTYDFPCGNEALKRIKCCTYMPFLPSYKERKATCRNSVSDTERMYANNYQKDSNSVTELWIMRQWDDEYNWWVAQTYL